MRDTEGSLRRSASVSTRGRCTRPCTSNSCVAGSSSGTPEWCRSKCSPDGVITPAKSCIGVRLAPVPGVTVGANQRALDSWPERSPYTRRPAPGVRPGGAASRGDAAATAAIVVRNRLLVSPDFAIRVSPLADQIGFASAQLQAF